MTKYLKDAFLFTLLAWKTGHLKTDLLFKLLFFVRFSAFDSTDLELLLLHRFTYTICPQESL